MFRFPGRSVTIPAIAAILTLSACSEEQPPADGGAAQTLPGATAAPGAPGNIGELQAEYAGIQRQLGTLQQQAMTDSTVQAAYTNLETWVEGQMTDIDPDFVENRDRLAELAMQMRQAEASADSAKVQSLLAEGGALQTKIQEVQAQVMQREEVSARMTAFQEQVVGKMKELDPDAGEMIDRAQAIAEQFQGPPAPGG